MINGCSFSKTTDKKVAETFWQPGNISARQYKAVLGADAEANAALEAVALDSLRDAAVRDGVMKRSSGLAVTLAALLIAAPALADITGRAPAGLAEERRAGGA